MIRVLLAIILIATEVIACPIKVGGVQGGCSVAEVRSYVTPTPTATPTPTPTPSGDYAAAKSTWEANMTAHGATWCTSTEGSEDGVWYYDGVYVMDAIRDYTADAATWDTCVNSVRTVYKGIIDAAGTLAGRRAFAEGLTNVGDGSYISTIISDTTYSNLFHNCADPDSIHQTLVASREAAYLLRNLIIAGDNAVSSPYSIDDIDQSDMCTNLGNSHTITEEDALQFVEWHAERFYTDTPYVQSFMAGITASALIEYYENVSPDAGVKAHVKSLADWLWANAWDAGNSKFNYCTVRAGGTDCNAINPNIDNSDNLYSIDLNNLISPMYAWLYKEGEGTGYRDKFDTIFAAGVDGATTNFKGKTFSQNYRETFKAVAWRDAGPATVPVGTLDGVNDYVEFDSALIPPTGDFVFTMEFNPGTLTGTYKWIFGIWSGDNNTSFYFKINTTKLSGVYLGQDFSDDGGVGGSGGDLSNAWHTVKLVRSGNSLTGFIDDIQFDSATVSSSNPISTDNMFIGQLNGVTNNNWAGKFRNIVVEGVHDFKVNEGSGLVLNDSIGSAEGTINAVESEFWANSE